MEVDKHGKNKYDYIELHTDPPCKTFRCDNFKSCKYGKISCDSFNWYVNSGKATDYKMRIRNYKNKPKTVVRIDFDFIPDKKTYLKIFEGT